MIEKDKYVYADILDTFVNLIGYISIIINFASYNESKKKYKKILIIIIDWMVKFEQNRNLNFIDYKELNQIYKTLDELQTKYICNDLMGSESEFSDFALNWMQHLVTIIKKNSFKGEK